MTLTLVRSPQVFLEPLRALSICPSHVLPILFSNIDEILRLNEGLLQALEQAKSGKGESLGRTMSKYVRMNTFVYFFWTNKDYEENFHHITLYRARTHNSLVVHFCLFVCLFVC
jgi:hypothetical protein